MTLSCLERCAVVINTILFVRNGGIHSYQRSWCLKKMIWVSKYESESARKCKCNLIISFKIWNSGVFYFLPYRPKVEAEIIIGFLLSVSLTDHWHFDALEKLGKCTWFNCSGSFYFKIILSHACQFILNCTAN